MSNGVKQLLAFDFGLKQIGVASASRLIGSASELAMIGAKEGQPQWPEIEKLIQEWKPDLCLVGLPLNMDGSESVLSQRARKFANQIHGRFGTKIEMVDERLSSFEAKHQSAEQGHRGDYKKAPIDALAAKILAEQWMRNN